MRIGRNWHHDNTPKTLVAQLGLELVKKTREIIDDFNPSYFIIENPRGKLRKLDVMQDLPRRTVTYCQYGQTNMKPTDLWGGGSAGGFPNSLQLRPMCKNGDPCHNAAPRGSHSLGTTQDTKLTPAQRALVPPELSLDICLALEEDMTLHLRN
jgi:hypothetical protein